MWILQNIYNEHCFCLLSIKKKYTVGRLGADIELSSDNSISRAHAIIHVESPQKPNGTVQLVLQDDGSKYGTFRNKGIEKNENLAKGERIQLKATDLIRFGRFKNIWKIQEFTLNVITSSLTRAEQSEINELIEHLDGNVLQQWTSDCTHLTMNEPSITVKLLQALTEQKEVVNMTYWRNLLKCARGGMFKMIKPELYRPRFLENFDLNHKPSRRFLFKGHTIVFLHRKHYDMYESIVRGAGGCCKDLNSGVQKSFLLKSNTIVIQYTPSTQTQSSQTINSIADYLQSHSKRIIPEYELGLAILHCSTERYCNPSFITPSENVQADDCIDLTDNLDVEYTIPETNPNTMESSLNISVTETPVENDDNTGVKRKHSDIVKVPSSGSDEDEETLFQFAKKIRHSHSTEQPVQTNAANKSQQQQSNAATEALSQEQCIKSNNLEKKISSNTGEANEANKKQSRKRPLIPVLSNDNDGNDDLFDFGDKTNSSQHKTKRNRQQFTNNSDDELFAFNHNQEIINLNEEDSNDMKPTQEYILAHPTKRIRKEIHIMPKPKVLPSKVSVADWLSCALNSIKIKTVNTTMENGDGIKLEKDCKVELSSEEDQEWLEGLKNAVVIRPIAAIKYNKKTDKSHYKYKSSFENSLGHAAPDGVKNFKAFVKRYQIPSQRDVEVIHLRSRIV